MFRFVARPLSRSLALLLLVGLFPVQAQSPAANVPVQAVISYANLLTPGLVAELGADHAELDDLAFALLDRYITDGILAPDVADMMKLALTTGVLPYEATVMFLADVYNGTEPAPADLAAAQAQLDEAGISAPVADASGNVSQEALEASVTESSSTLVTNPNNPYNDAITPTTGG